MANKYSIDVEHIHPMETAPVWDYYNGGVECVILFIEIWDATVATVTGFYDRDLKCWVDYYREEPITEEIIGWLPNFDYVGIH